MSPRAKSEDSSDADVSKNDSRDIFRPALRNMPQAVDQVLSLMDEADKNKLKKEMGIKSP